MDNPGAIDNGTNASGTTQDTSAQDSGVKVCPVTGLSGECPGGS